jgi:hypothetical protein
MNAENSPQVTPGQKWHYKPPEGTPGGGADFFIDEVIEAPPDGVEKAVVRMVMSETGAIHGYNNTMTVPTFTISQMTLVPTG